MKFKYAVATFAVCVELVAVVPAARAQTAATDQSASQATSAATSPAAQSASAASVPQMIRFNGTLLDAQGRPIAGPTGVVFALYAQETGGSALWMETQNVSPDAAGNYTVLLGSQSAHGIPTDLFTGGDARWLGIQVGEAPEKLRIVLVSVPYAMKAGDAETIGGLPPSAFVLAGQPQSGAAGSGSSGQPPLAPASATNASIVKSNITNPAVTGKGVLDYIPIWDSASDIMNSTMFQSGTNIGIGTITPAAKLDVNGSGDIRDTLTLFPKSTDNTLAVSGTTFAVSSSGLVTFVSGQKFPGTGNGTITGITTATGSGLSGGGTSGTLSLEVPAAGITNAMLKNSELTLNANTAGGLTVPGAMTLGSTYTIGLKPCTSGQVLEYSGTAWNCAGVPGTGTITGVKAGTDLTGGGTGGSVTVNLDTTKVPQLAAANTFTANQSVTGNNEGFLLDVTQSGAGAAVVGSAVNGTGVIGAGSTAVYGRSTSSSGIAGLFWNAGGGTILDGLGDSGTVFSVGNTGNVTATSYSGGNASLTTATTGASAVSGTSTATGGYGSNGGSFSSSSPQGTAVVGVNTAGGFAGYFQGPVTVTGSLGIGGDTPMSHSPRMVFSGYLDGYPCNCSEGFAFINNDEPITITRMTISVLNAQSGCSNNADIYVGATSFVKVQISSIGFVDSGPLNMAIPAGSTVQIGGDSASGGTFCQSPGKINVNVEYKMQ